MTNDIQFDPAKPVRTRDGRAARIICTDAKGGLPVIALITDSEGYESPNLYAISGSFFKNTIETSDHDLVNIPEQRHRWYNVYEPGSAGAHYTRSEADERATPGRIAVLHLIFEDNKLVSSEVEHV